MTTFRSKSDRSYPAQHYPGRPDPSSLVKIDWLCDTDGVRALEIDAEAFAPIPAELWTPQVFRSTWIEPNISAFKVEARYTGLLAGYLMYARQPERITIIRLAIAPEWRRRGIGRYLIHSAQEADPERRGWVAYAHEMNVPAIRFLVACGYHATGLGKVSLHPDGRDDYRFVRKHPLHGIPF